MPPSTRNKARLGNIPPPLAACFKDVNLPPRIRCYWRSILLLYPYIIANETTSLGSAIFQPHFDRATNGYYFPVTIDFGSDYCYQAYTSTNNLVWSRHLLT
ncbi:hypothetical protein NXS19_010199 [Fusarium pseudograminearum]|nr:hypothetical protein NXS19_010199 [Fusarium pseudograminearum]